MKDRFPYIYKEGVEYATPQNYGVSKLDAKKVAKSIKRDAQKEIEVGCPQGFPLSVIVAERKGKWYAYSNFTVRNTNFWPNHKRLPKVGEGY